MRPGLLGQHGVARETGADALEQQLLGAAVVLGDEVDAALVLGMVSPAEALPEDRSRLASELDRGVAKPRRIERDHSPPRAALWMQMRA